MHKIVQAIIILVAAFFAIILGLDVASSAYDKLSIYAIVGICIYFVIHGWKNVWSLAALLSMSGLLFIHNFTFNGAHLFVLMLCIASVISFAHKRFTRTPKLFLYSGSRTTALLLVCLLTYGAIHYIVYYTIPYSPNDYSIRTSTKAYFECYSTMFCCMWLIASPYSFSLKPNWPKTLIIIIFVCLCANIAIRGYMYSQGFQASDRLSSNNEVNLFSIYIPIINAFPGVYILRELCPYAIAILLMFASNNNFWRNCGGLIKAVILTSILLCFVGAIFSGGRATLLFCIAVTILVAMLRKRIGLLAVMGTTGLLVVAAVNIFSHQINSKAPLYISRSLQLVMIEKGLSYRGIEHSQYVRNEARAQAIKEWRKDNRVFFFGRSVFYISSEDAEYNNDRFGDDGFVMNNMRSGRTHNMVTDLLLQYGIFGFIIYTSSYVLIIIFMLRMYARIDDTKHEAKSLLGATLIYSPLILVYQLLGGGFLPAIIPLTIGIVRSASYTTRRDASQADATLVES